MTPQNAKKAVDCKKIQALGGVWVPYKCITSTGGSGHSWGIGIPDSAKGVPKVT